MVTYPAGMGFFPFALTKSDTIFVILVTIAPNGTIQLATPGSEGLQGLQAVTMANSGGAQQSTTILQYAQTPDGQQILVPSNQVVVQGEHTMAYSNKISPRFRILL